MAITTYFSAIVGGSLLLTSCVSSQKWIDDDVYTLKSVEVPTDTDLSDETDYATFLLNKETRRTQTTYYNDFYANSYSPFGFRPHHILAGYSFYNYSNFYGRNLGWGWGTNNYNIINGYGYGYYGINYYCNPYGNWGGYGTNYGWNYPTYTNPVYSGIHVNGPRGAIAGYGGVRSNSTQSYKSTPINGTPSTAVIRTEAKPVMSYDRIGRSSGPGAISSGRTVTYSTNRPTTTQRAINTTPRPITTTGRTNNSPNTGRTTTAGPRNQGTTISTGRTSGSSTPTTGRTSGTSSGGSRSTGGGGTSTGGSKTVGRR